MELWGGIECSLSRVGDRRYDQLARSGHYSRASDLEAIAELGIRTMRYPLLWERAAPAAGAEIDWSFADERLPRLRELGVTPIAGLVHHGSGPGYAPLGSSQFATGLAQYAGEVAKRFPWIDAWTPVNEPLTTARFCGLYGHWHPHERSSRHFARLLLDECRATVLAMRAVRGVNPRARLVQTDDLGTIYAAPSLRYQADFENERRWLGWDLLCGFVTPAHALYRDLINWGIAPRELAWFEENPCPPDVIGIDHYVTSDRYLDEDRELYPANTWGGNGRAAYADVEAVRVRVEPGTSLASIVTAAARRYRAAVVLTEVHIGCSVDEQQRWLHEAWTTCSRLASTGIDVRAITAWALLGSFDWDSLMTRDRGHYEPGAFDLRGGAPRRTPLAEHITALATGCPLAAARLRPAGEGWWRRDERLLFGVGRAAEGAAEFVRRPLGDAAWAPASS
jgi:dTDP-4-dehydrorhamnose reductase